jgi:hypothetical protein
MITWEEDEMIPKADFINRLIEFAQADLNNISIMEKRKWFNEKAVIIGGLYTDIFYLEEVSQTEEGWAQVVRFQQEWLACLNWLVDHLNEELQVELLVPNVFGWGVAEESGAFQYDNWSDRGGEKQNIGKVQKQFMFTDKARKDHRIEEIVFPPGASYFFEALDGFPTSSLLRCSHCEKIFFNPSKRKKVYCSPHCQNAAGVQRLRKRRGG